MSHENIQLGQRVHNSLEGGRYGTVVNVIGEQSPESVRVIGGFMQTGGRAEFDIAWDDAGISKRVPECIVRGVQWEVLDEKGNPDKALADSLAYLAAEKVRKQEDEAQYNLAVEKMRTAYPNLLQGGREVVEKNIRKLLKESFPDTKFSVKKVGYNSTRVHWEDGPTKDQVDEIANRFQDGHFDGMTDCQGYIRTPFSDVYGNVTYVFSDRSLSYERVAEAIEMINTDYGKFFDENSIPRPTVEKYKSGSLRNIDYNGRGNSLFDLVRDQLNEMDENQNKVSSKIMAR